MIILGINAYHADSSAAIFVDGKLIAAIEEERFRRVKHWAGFPELAIAFCIKEAGVSYAEVDHFAIGRDPKAKVFKKLLYLAKHPAGSFATVKDRLSNSRKVSSIEKELSRLSGLPAKSFAGKIKNIEHHRSHIASAFFASPFDKAACLSILFLFTSVINIYHNKNDDISTDIKEGMTIHFKRKLPVNIKTNK